MVGGLGVGVRWFYFWPDTPSTPPIDVILIISFCCRRRFFTARPPAGTDLLVKLAEKFCVATLVTLRY